MFILCCLSTLSSLTTATPVPCTFLPLSYLILPEHFLRVRHCVDYFTWIILLNSNNNSEVGSVVSTLQVMKLRLAREAACSGHCQQGSELRFNSLLYNQEIFQYVGLERAAMMVHFFKGMWKVFQRWQWVIYAVTSSRRQILFRIQGLLKLNWNLTYWLLLHDEIILVKAGILETAWAT